MPAQLRISKTRTARPRNPGRSEICDGCWPGARNWARSGRSAPSQRISAIHPKSLVEARSLRLEIERCGVEGGFGRKAMSSWSSGRRRRSGPSEPASRCWMRCATWRCFSRSTANCPLLIWSRSQLRMLRFPEGFAIGRSSFRGRPAGPVQKRERPSLHGLEIADSVNGTTCFQATCTLCRICRRGNIAGSPSPARQCSNGWCGTRSLPRQPGRRSAATIAPAG